MIIPGWPRLRLRLFVAGRAFARPCALIALGEGEPTRVLAHGAKKRCPAPVWSALVFPFLTFYYGNGGAKFSKRSRFLPKFESTGCAVRALAISKWRALSPSRCLLPSGRIPDFQDGNPLGERIVSWGLTTNGHRLRPLRHVRRIRMRLRLT
jgi:hypothetical protein